MKVLAYTKELSSLAYKVCQGRRTWRKEESPAHVENYTSWSETHSLILKVIDPVSIVQLEARCLVVIILEQGYDHCDAYVMPSNEGIQQ
jgi:hypothetical protein